MTNRILIPALVFIIASCASTAPGNRVGSSAEKANAMNMTPSSTDLAVVYIVRDNTFSGSGVNVLFGVDINRIVALENDSFTRIELPPGIYRFKFVVNAEDFNKGTSDYAHGAINHRIKAGIVNIVLFEGGPFKLSDHTLYGRNQVMSLTREADYQVPYHPVIRTASKLPETAPHMKSAASATSNKIKTSSIAKQQASAQFSKLRTSAKCALKNKNWAYTGTNCKNGFANGKGRAVDKQNLKFLGTFIDGQRVKGEIHQGGKMIFSGRLVNDKPDGNAICLHEGEHEECRFFRGKRIDTLYKMRKENLKMKQEMARMQTSRPVAASNTQAKGIGDYAMDAVQKEATDRAANFIFDSLF